MKGKYAGGIASRMGRPYGGQICYIKNCYSTAEVISTGDECGGIVGSMYENSEVSYCYSTGVLIGANSVGGIAALPSEGAKITSCVAWNWKMDIRQILSHLNVMHGRIWFVQDFLRRIM